MDAGPGEKFHGPRRGGAPAGAARMGRLISPTMTQNSEIERAESGAVVLDVKGLNCPMPLLKAKKVLNELEPRTVLKVIATDPGSVRDFQVFARQSGHELLDSREEQGTYVHVLRKKSA
jgi:tRNA 2-thiouridine synthesizing protein A